VHPLWFYKHQHDNWVRSKLFVACQRWWFQWRFWFVPSVPEYLREEEEHKPDPWPNPIERNQVGLHLQDEVAVVKTLIINSNNPVHSRRKRIFCNLSFYLRQLHGVQLKIESRSMTTSNGPTFPHTRVTCNNASNRTSVQVLQMNSSTSHTCLSPGDKLLILLEIPL